MTLFIDDRIFNLQSNGGISHVWANLAPHLQAQLQEIEFDDSKPDIFLSTYYGLAPEGLDSIALCYDFIAERYSPIGRFHTDAVQKRRVVSEAKAVIAISQWVAGDVLKYCNKGASVAHCGTTMRRATPKAVEVFKQAHAIDEPYILVVGKRGLYKNVQALYQAWQFFAGRQGFMIVCVGGEGASFADRTFASQHPSQWLQAQLPNEQMNAAYTGAAMLVYPSLYEGFGLPVLEAMACGTPVVCAKRGGMPEYAGFTPFYCDVHRPSLVAQAMNEALQADYQRQESAMDIATRYTWERMASQIINVIKDMPQDD